MHFIHIRPMLFERNSGLSLSIVCYAGRPACIDRSRRSVQLGHMKTIVIKIYEPIEYTPLSPLSDPTWESERQ
jgi:hypothetical protein